MLRLSVMEKSELAISGQTTKRINCEGRFSNPSQYGKGVRV